MLSIRVTIISITSNHLFNPVIAGEPYPCQMQKNQTFSCLFRHYAKHNGLKKEGITIREEKVVLELELKLELAQLILEITSTMSFLHPKFLTDQHSEKLSTSRIRISIINTQELFYIR